MIACVLAVSAARDRRWRRRVLALAVAHLFIGGGLLLNWCLTGIPKPWVD